MQKYVFFVTRQNLFCLCRTFLEKTAEKWRIDGLANGQISAPTPRTKTIFSSTFTARCTVYVQYMYSICTLRKRTNTVHILYIYCTTGGEGTANTKLSTTYKTAFLRPFSSPRYEAAPPPQGPTRPKRQKQNPTFFNRDNNFRRPLALNGKTLFNGIFSSLGGTAHLG